MRKAFSAATALLLLLVVTQFFLAGAGAFDNAPRDESFPLHRILGNVVMVLAVVLTILAAAARLPGRLIATTALIAGLCVLQPVIANVARVVEGPTHSGGTAGALVFGLHAVNALVILGVATSAHRQARGLARPAAARGGQSAELVRGPGHTA